MPLRVEHLALSKFSAVATRMAQVLHSRLQRTNIMTMKALNPLMVVETTAPFLSPYKTTKGEYATEVEVLTSIHLEAAITATSAHVFHDVGFHGGRCPEQRLYYYVSSVLFFYKGCKKSA